MSENENRYPNVFVDKKTNELIDNAKDMSPDVLYPQLKERLETYSAKAQSMFEELGSLLPTKTVTLSDRRTITKPVTPTVSIDKYKMDDKTHYAPYVKFKCTDLEFELKGREKSGSEGFSKIVARKWVDKKPVLYTAENIPEEYKALLEKLSSYVISGERSAVATVQFDISKNGIPADSPKVVVEARDKDKNPILDANGNPTKKEVYDTYAMLREANEYEKQTFGDNARSHIILGSRSHKYFDTRVDITCNNEGNLTIKASMLNGDIKEKLDENGNPMLDEKGEKITYPARTIVDIASIDDVKGEEGLIANPHIAAALIYAIEKYKIAEKPVLTPLGKLQRTLSRAFRDAKDLVPAKVDGQMVNNAYAQLDTDEYGEKLTVRTHEGDVYEFIENDNEILGNILVFTEDGLKADGSKKYKCERVPMDADSIANYVHLEYMAKAFNDVVGKNEKDVSDGSDNIEI